MARLSLMTLVAALGLQACVPPVPEIEKTTFAASLQVDLGASRKIAGGEYVRDLSEGNGLAVSVGRMMQVHYVGSFVDGKVFDSNSDPMTPFRFRYGVSEVIAGWDQGLSGIKAGGVRQLIIPPKLAYGEEGAPPTIPSNAILVFTVTVVAVE